MAGKKEHVKILDLPDMTPAALDSLDVYLAEVIRQCRCACARLRAHARQGTATYPSAHATYWRNAAGAITWVRGQIRQAREARGRKGSGHHDGSADA